MAGSPLGRDALAFPGDQPSPIQIAAVSGPDGAIPEDREAVERAYNPRVLVPDATAIFSRWPERAAATRARHPPLADLRYGHHPRETLDLFRCPDPVGTVIFIHGGYWRAFSKDEFSWVADGFLGFGLSVAVLNYPLCPEVPLARIVTAIRMAFLHLYRSVLSEGERRRIAITGHSAGGYLSALHLATDWSAHGLPSDPIAGIVPISGLFALADLVATSMNEAVGLDLASAGELSLTGRPWRSRAAVTLVVGGNESPEFHRQSADLAAAWADLGPKLLDVAGRNHFDVIDALAEPGSLLHRSVLAALEGRTDD